MRKEVPWGNLPHIRGQSVCGTSEKEKHQELAPLGRNGHVCVGEPPRGESPRCSLAELKKLRMGDGRTADSPVRS